MTTTETMNIGIEEKHTKAVSALLCQVLADAHVLYIKKRNFHWNLVGPRFHSLHEFFEGQYGELEGSIDEIAERIRQIGGVSPGSMEEMLEHASLSEVEGELIDGDAAIKALLDDHETIVRTLRGLIEKCEDEYNDIGTGDFLTGLLQKHEQMAWMLRSFISKA